MSRFARAVLIAGAVLLASTATAFAATPRVPVGDAARLPVGAARTGALAARHVLRLTLTLDSRAPLALNRLAAAVTTPGSRQYGRTLTVAQFAQRFGATPTTLAQVRRAMRRNGLRVVRTYANGLSIGVAGPAAAVERTFATRLSQVRTADGRRTIANDAAPTLPASIGRSVQAVFGLDGLADPQPLDAAGDGRSRGSADGVRSPARRTAARSHVTTGGPQPCAAATAAAQPTAGAPHTFGYTDDLLASAYGLPALYATGDLGQGQTIALYEAENVDPNDIATFQACYGTHASVTIDPLDGDSDPVDDGTDGDAEAALDAEQVIGLAPSASVLIYETTPSDPNADGALLAAIASNPAAKIVSISYAGCESLLGAAGARFEATYFQEMAVQGQSVFAGSGDTGPQGCQRQNGDSSTLGVSDPASQPTVTGVGGTSLYSGTSASPTPWNGTGTPIEGIWNTTSLETTYNHTLTPAATGGGVSSLWAMPSFQAGAAAGLNVVNGSSGSGGCGAATCREVPDVSADAEAETGTIIYAHLASYAAGHSAWTPYGGTSAAAPMWAAFAALTNVLPTCRGLSIGDINPSLYALAGSSYATYFRDITAAAAFTSATNSNANNGASNAGLYPVGTGFDLATGLGSPLMNNLAGALCATRAPVYTVTLGPPPSTTIAAGTAASLQVAANDSGGAALTFTQSGLPAGLALNPSTGLITGTPTLPGSYPVTVSGEDFATNAGSTQFTLTVTQPPAQFGAAALSGITRRRARLRFTVTAPAGRRLRSVTVHLSRSSGLSIKRSDRGITITASGARGRTRYAAQRGRRSLTLRLRRPARTVFVTLGPDTLGTSPRLAAAARRRTVHVPVTISATDTSRHTTWRTMRLRVAEARRHRHRR